MPSLRTLSIAVACDGLDLGCRSYAPDSPRGVVVLLHGIPSTAPPDPADTGYPGLARRLSHRGWAAVWADLRAVRGSPGFFSIEGWVRDAIAVVESARAMDGWRGKPLALIGSSAGGAVSAEATRRGAPVDALGLLAAPAAWLSFAAHPAARMRRIIEEAGMALAPEVLEDPSAWAAEFEKVTTESAVAELRVPILVVHGTADDVVPVAHARRIARRHPDTELHMIEGAGHRLRSDERALKIVFDWLDRAMP